MQIQKVNRSDNSIVAIDLPWSKSMLNRLQIMHALEGELMDEAFLGSSGDVDIMYEAIASNDHEINVGDAGTAARFLLAYFASREGSYTISGSSRMMQRPIAPLVNALLELGADISYQEEDGCFPINIEGRKLSGSVEMDVDVSSQFVSALLLIAPYCEGGMDIKMNGQIVSGSYIQMTVAMMRHAGIEISHDHTENTISISEGRYDTSEVLIERDWSAAAFWFEAVYLDADLKVLLQSIKAKSLQGDARIKDILSYDVQCEEVTGGLLLSKAQNKVSHELIDLSSHPDLFPPLACMFCLGNEEIKFFGLDHLAHKESDRVVAIGTELGKLGAVVERIADKVYRLKPGKEESNTIEFKVYNDHRLAMGFGLLSLSLPSVHLDAPEVVSKSYPEFWNQAKRIGLVLETD